jgi:hypothetical protein
MIVDRVSCVSGWYSTIQIVDKSAIIYRGDMSSEII